MSSKHGFIIQPNEIFQDPEWLGQKFNKMTAHLHLRHMGVHKETHVTYNKQTVTLQKGQIVTSEEELRKLFKWGSNNTVRKFLNELCKDNKISMEKHRFGTIITINYMYFETAGPTAGPKTKEIEAKSSKLAQPTAGPLQDQLQDQLHDLETHKTAGPTAGPKDVKNEAKIIDIQQTTAGPTAEPKDDETAGPTAGPTAGQYISINNKYIKDDDKSVPCIKKLANELFKNKSDKSLSSSFLNCLKEFRPSNSDLFDNPDLLYEQKELLPQFVAIYTLNKSYGTQIKNFGSYSHCTIEQFEAGKSEPQGFINAAINLQEKLIEQEELMQYENPEVDISAKKPKRATKDIISSLHPKNKKRPDMERRQNRKAIRGFFKASKLQQTG